MDSEEMPSPSTSKAERSAEVERPEKGDKEEEDKEAATGAQGSSQLNGETVEKTFSEKSISMTASAMGITNLTSEASLHLADDLFYKMRELIYISKVVLYKNKRKTLTTHDIKKALKMLGRCRIYGHDSKDEVNYIYIPKADIYVEDDPEVELAEVAISDSEYTQKGDPYIQGAWIMTEDYSEEPSLSQPSSYYLQIAKTVMSGSPAHLKVALNDLRTNPKIGPICPYFLNLVALTVKKVPRDTNLTNALIGTVHAIAHNKFVDPSPYLAVNRAANSLLKIVIEVNVDKHYDDLALRVRAGLLLAKVVLIWSIELKQQIDIIRHLLQHLLDPTLPLQSHYGAIVALTALGQRTLDFYLWPVMERYLTLLENRANTSLDVMVQHVMAAILVAARSTRRKEQISGEQLKKLSKVDQMLYSSFGDTVTPFRMVSSGPPIYPCVKRDPVLTSMRLKLQRTMLPKLYHTPANLSEVFELTNLKCDRSKLPQAMYYVPGSIQRKPMFAYVARNNRFCSPLHKNSAVGDLLTIL